MSGPTDSFVAITHTAFISVTHATNSRWRQRPCRLMFFWEHAWSKVCGYHKLKICTCFFSCISVQPISIIDWKQHLLLATHCVSHVECFPWNTFWEIHSELNHLSRMESSLESILRSPCTPNGSLRRWSLHRHHVFFVEWGWDTLNIPLVVSTHSLKPLQQLHHQ